MDRLFARHRTRGGMLVDTNLLVLLVVGLLDPRRITTFKRTSAYDREDFELLVRAVDYVDTTVTTPHVLTETSNLLGQLPESREGRAVLGALVQQQWHEKQRPSSELAAQEFFPAFGLTDTALVEIDAGAHLVLTDDMPLWHFLTEHGHDAISFNHLRMANW